MEFVELYKKAYEFLETQKESRKEIPFGEVALIMTSFAEQQLKNCNLQNVSQRSELLKAFREWWNKDNQGVCTTITHKDIERYLESL